METLTDGRNEYVETELDTIVAPLILEEDVWEFINSKGEVNTADNNQNFHYGRYKAAIWKRLTGLTKATAPWFGIEQRKAKRAANFITREAFTVEDEYEPKIRTLSFTAAERFGIMVNGWRWVIGSKPA